MSQQSVTLSGNRRSIFSPDISRIACCDRGYGRPSGRPRASDPATYCSSTPRIQLPAVARWHTLLHGLATAIHETSGLRQTLKESHYGLVECLSTFKVNEMTSIGEGLQLSSSNALRQHSAVFSRYQLVTIRCENKGRGLKTAEAVAGIEAADRPQLSLQSVIRLQGSV